MKEYKILKADSTEYAEQLMNEMAAAGWNLFSVTDWHGDFLHKLAIVFERDA